MIKNTKIRCVFLLLSALVLILIIKAYKDKISIDNDIIINDNEELLPDLNYNVIITNKSKSNAYFRGNPDLFSCRMYDNEKVHHVTMEINLDPNYFKIYVPEVPYFNIETEIAANTTKMFRVMGDVNNKNLRYEADMRKGITESQYSELCSDIHILFFFTRNPYKLNTYPEYIETMRKNGYAVLGNRVNNDFYFTITDTETKVNDKAINDILFFIHKYLYPSNLSGDVLETVTKFETTQE